MNYLCFHTIKSILNSYCFIIQTSFTYGFHTIKSILNDYEQKLGLKIRGSFPYYKVNFKLKTESSTKSYRCWFPYYKVNFKPENRFPQKNPCDAVIKSFHTIKSILNFEYLMLLSNHQLCFHTIKSILNSFNTNNTINSH